MTREFWLSLIFLSMLYTPDLLARSITARHEHFAYDTEGIDILQNKCKPSKQQTDFQEIITKINQFKLYDFVTQRREIDAFNKKLIFTIEIQIPNLEELENCDHDTR